MVPDSERVRIIDADALDCIEYVCDGLKDYLQKEGFNASEYETLLAGSTTERFSIPISKEWYLPTCDDIKLHALASDLDYMIWPTDEQACLHSSAGGKYQVKTKIDGFSNDFVNIYKVNDQSLLSSKEVKEMLKKSLKGMKLKDLPGYETERNVGCCCYYKNVHFATMSLQGPAIKIQMYEEDLRYQTERNRKFEGDIVYSIQCSDWPFELSDWAWRDKRWPSREVVEQIMTGGCHLVPKPCFRDQHGLTWRISLSKAEIELSKLIPEKARVCLLGLKTIAKDHLSPISKRLSSYILKTQLLHVLEKNEPESWENQPLEDCFHFILNLMISIQQKQLQHFWIPSINLFEDFPDKEISKFMKKLSKIRKCPEKYIEPLNLE